MNYAKRGSAVRWENGRVISVVENGTAEEDDDFFRCAPAGGPHLPRINPRRVTAEAEKIRDSVHLPVTIERLIVSEGVSEQSARGVVWTEEHERVHVSLVCRRRRVLIDLALFDAGEIASVARTLSRLSDAIVAPPSRLLLAPRVTAALLPPLHGTGVRGAALRQSEGGRDGWGRPVEECPVESGPWPNWYRPSYRVRPVRRPFNLRLVPFGQPGEGLPRAVALLAPPSLRSLDLLVEADGEVFATRVTLLALEAAGEAERLYPHGAGAFGAEALVSVVVDGGR